MIDNNLTNKESHIIQYCVQYHYLVPVSSCLRQSNNLHYVCIFVLLFQYTLNINKYSIFDPVCVLLSPIPLNSARFVEIERF